MSRSASAVTGRHRADEAGGRADAGQDKLGKDAGRFPNEDHGPDGRAGFLDEDAAMAMP